MDRQLLGVLGIAIIIGTVLTLVVIPGSDPVHITGIEYPKTMQRINDEYAFSIGLLANRDIEDIEFRVRTFIRFEIRQEGLEVVNRGNLEEFIPIPILGGALQTLGFDPTPREKVIETEAATYDFYFYDFLPAMEILYRQEKNPLYPLTTTSYGFLFQGDDLILSFKGGGEIFPNELSTISKLLVEVNGQSVVLWERGDEWIFDLGRISISEIRKGDRIDFFLYIDGQRVWVWKLVQLLDIRVDGELVLSEEFLINV
jgi:hypothetical protein